MELLKRHLSAVPNEYSYFDSGRLNSWRGPQHWKFRSEQHMGVFALRKNPSRIISINKLFTNTKSWHKLCHLLQTVEIQVADTGSIIVLIRGSIFLLTSHSLSHLFFRVAE